MRRLTAAKARTTRSSTRGSGPAPAVKASTSSTSPSSPFEAGAQTRRTRGWHAPTVSPNQALLGSLTTLRDRSRTAVRNDGYAKGASDKLVSNLVGTGICPLSKATDATFRKQVQALWLRWTDESDADGLLDFYGQETQLVRAAIEGGEVFIRLRQRLPGDGLSVPMQIQVLEPELCPHTYTTTLPNGNRVRAGIEFDAIGRRVAYYFYPARPGDFQDFDPSILRRVPSDNVIHHYDPVRPGQLRGIPYLTQALIRLHEMDKFDDATLLRQQIQNLFAGFVKTLGSDTGSTDINPLTGLAADTTRNDRDVVTMEPGSMQMLEAGEDVVFTNPPGVPATYPDFVRQQLYHISAATGVPYETLTGDLRGVTDRTVRIILHEFRRRLQAWQHQLIAFQVCRPIWSAWLDRAILAGALDVPSEYWTGSKEPWAAVAWMPQRWPYLHPVQDIQAQKDAIRDGFASRTSTVAEYGDDAEAIDAEQAADNARADELGLIYDSDGRQRASGPSGPNPSDGQVNEPVSSQQG
jgi:lambda family phage portal protein